jgi:predicted ester cyclase
MHSFLTRKGQGSVATAGPNLSEIYLGYIACLNRQDWSSLRHFVTDDMQYNDKPLGLGGYLNMLKAYCEEIPDVYFDVRTLIASPPLVASRLVFNCAPANRFLGLPVRGKRISYSENAFYLFDGEKIGQIWSVMDKMAIEAQL